MFPNCVHNTPAFQLLSNASTSLAQPKIKRQNVFITPVKRRVCEHRCAIRGRDSVFTGKACPRRTWMKPDDSPPRDRSQSQDRNCESADTRSGETWNSYPLPSRQQDAGRAHPHHPAARSELGFCTHPSRQKKRTRPSGGSRKDVSENRQAAERRCRSGLFIGICQTYKLMCNL